MIYNIYTELYSQIVLQHALVGDWPCNLDVDQTRLIVQSLIGLAFINVCVSFPHKSSIML